MIREISNNSKGVTLVALMVAVVIILILTSIVTFNFQGSVKTTKLENLKADISNLRDRVEEYYAEYGSIPIGREYTNIDHIREAGVISEATDTGKFYVLQISKLSNLILYYGTDYEKINDELSDEELNQLRDLYIINEVSHNIFYVDGIYLNREWYYTDYEKKDIDTSAVNLRYVDNVKIPEGYTYVSGKKDTGIKISDEQNNQFVWIPVENYNEFIGENEDNTAENTEDITENTGDIEENKDNSTDENELIQANVLEEKDSTDIEEENLSEEMKKIYTSIKLNKGFYIATLGDIDQNVEIQSDETIVTECYEAQVKAVERWIKDNPSRAEAINYEEGEIKNRITLCLTNEEKWTEVYQSNDETELKYKDKYENEVYIPNGFQVSLKEGTNSINKGLLIKNAETEDTYIWVPVPDSVFKTAENEEDYENIEKDLKAYAKNYSKKEDEDSGNEQLENDSSEETLSPDNNIIDEGNDNENTTTSGETEDQYSDEYYAECGIESEEEYNTLKNKMLSSIYTKKGFWISQYEIGASNYAQRDDDAKKRIARSNQGQYVYNYIKQADAQKIATNMESGNETSSLLFGIQWDLTCKFIKENSEKDIIDSTTWGNYKDSNFTIKNGQYIKTEYIDYTKIKGEYNKEDEEMLLTTGCTTRNSVLNIYDLAGNVAEWTLEKGPNDTAVVRGGSYTDEKGSVTNRNTEKTGQEVGFRVTMY